jgi:hypothetical protein
VGDTATWEEDCLAYEPFAGDRDVDVSVIRDGFVTARKPGICNTCSGEIRPGMRVRSRTERDNDERAIGTFRFCPECCDAMAKSWEDDGAAIEVREQLAWERRRSAPPSDAGTETGGGR